MNKYPILTFVILALAIFLGGFFTHQSISSDNFNQVKIQLIKQLKQSDLKIKKLESTRDSLLQVKSKILTHYDTIEQKHKHRKELPFSISDTGARYDFFTGRYPDLFTGSSSR